MTAATPKQTDYLLSLLNQAEGTSHRYLSQAKREIGARWGLSSGQISRLRKTEASRMIDDLLAETR